MRHREIDRARAHLLRKGLRPSGEAHLRLRPARDLDLAPGEADAAAERLADRLLAREARRVVLRRPGSAVAVLPFRVGEAARAEAGVAFESALDALDLDQVDADSHLQLSGEVVRNVSDRVDDRIRLDERVV